MYLKLRLIMPKAWLALLADLWQCTLKVIDGVIHMHSLILTAERSWNLCLKSVV